MLAWFKSAKDLMVFFGNPGCGKTYFCAAIYNHFRQKRVFSDMRYWHEDKLLSRVRGGMSSGEDYLDCARRLCDDQLIILDDMGSTGINEWRNEIYYTIIDERVSSRKPTIITTNLSKEKIFEQMGERINSRLMSVENTVINMRSDDLRQIPLDQR
jgi:DNA replication protein DnaC